MGKRRAGADVRERFGFAVRLRRGALGLTQEELAERAGIHRTYLSDVERGARNVSLVNVEKIDNNGGHVLLVGNGGYATINEAIAAAGNGDTILIAGGDYHEQVVINGKTGLHLVGVGDVNIIAPNDVTSTVMSSSGRSTFGSPSSSPL